MTNRLRGLLGLLAVAGSLPADAGRMTAWVLASLALGLARLKIMEGLGATRGPRRLVARHPDPTANRPEAEASFRHCAHETPAMRRGAA